MRWPASWLWLLLGSLCAVGLSDALLMGLSTGYFAGGFNTAYLDGTGPLLAYALGGAALDAGLVLGLWALSLPILRRVTTSPSQVFCAAGILGLGVPMAFAIADYNLHVTLGRLVSTSLLRVGSSGSSAGMAAVLVDELPPIGWLVGALVVGVALLIGAGRLERRIPRLAARLAPPPVRSVWLAFLVAASAGGGLLLCVAAVAAEDLRFGLGRKASGALLPQLVQRVTDWDRDGFGMLASPPDPAPWNGAIHPYAIDIPGNGVDENGVGGDHPADFALPEARTPRAAGASSPHLLLIYLESFRADLLDREINGREVTPFLRALAAQGARSERAFVHSPSTLPSRAQLFSGSVVARSGQRTLLDDFRARGYAVAWFSGQDDSYGGTDQLLGLERADVFYHARQDVARRTSRSATPVGLQVSWKTVLEHALAYVERADPARPQFLYVNFVDTHFPYTHDEVDDMLGVEGLERGEIRADRAEQVFRAYANTAANVDRAAELLVRACRARFGSHSLAVLVTGDHGQSFYETGTLGHGQQLHPAQTRVPFIVWGVGGDWPEPIGPSDVRALLARNLFQPRAAELPRARFAPDPQRRVFQYLGPLSRPERIAFRSSDRLVVFDFAANRAWQTGPSAPGDGEPAAPQDVLRLIRSWEVLQRVELAEAGERRTEQGG